MSSDLDLYLVRVWAGLLTFCLLFWAVVITAGFLWL